jgi:hypothetical protein
MRITWTCATWGDSILPSADLQMIDQQLAQLAVR